MFEYDHNEGDTFNIPIRYFRKSEAIDSLITLLNSDPKHIEKKYVLKFLQSIDFDRRWLKSFHFRKSDYSERFLLGIGLSRLVVNCRKSLLKTCDLIEDNFTDRNRGECGKLVNLMKADEILFNSILFQIITESYFDFFISKNRVLELMTAPVLLFQLTEWFIKNYPDHPKIKKLGISQLRIGSGDLISRALIEKFIFNQIHSRTTLRGKDSNTKPYLIRHFALKLFDSIQEFEDVTDNTSSTSSDAKNVFIGVLFCYLKVPDYPEIDCFETLDDEFYSKTKEKVKSILKAARSDLKKRRL